MADTDTPVASRVRSLRLGPDLRSLLDRFTAERGISDSLAIVLLCEDWIGRHSSDQAAIVKIGRQAGGTPKSIWMRDDLWQALCRRAFELRMSTARLIASIVQAGVAEAGMHHPEEEAALEGRA